MRYWGRPILAHNVSLFFCCWFLKWFSHKHHHCDIKLQLLRMSNIRHNFIFFRLMSWINLKNYFIYIFSWLCHVSWIFGAWSEIIWHSLVGTLFSFQCSLFGQKEILQTCWKLEPMRKTSVFYLQTFNSISFKLVLPSRKKVKDHHTGIYSLRDDQHVDNKN